MGARRIGILGIVVAACFLGSLALRYALDVDAPCDAAIGAGGPPEGIVSLKPSITETLFAIGAGPKVVGVTDYCNFPDEVTELEKVGGLYDVNIEAIRLLNPDLVILPGSQDELLADLRELGISCAMINKQENLDEIIDSIETIGRAVSREEEAVALAESLRQWRADLARSQSAGGRRTLISVSRNFSAQAIDEVYAAGPETFLSEILVLMGGENVLEPGSIVYPTLTAEALIRLNPEVIIEIAPGAIESGIAMDDAMAAWLSLGDVEAVREGRIFIFTEDYIAKPGPRIPLIAERFSEALSEAAAH